MNDEVQTTISVWQLALPFIAGPFAAIVTGVVTRLKARSSLKAVVNLAVSTLSGALLTLPANTGDVQWSVFLVGAFITWVTSIATHFGFWKPTGTTEAIEKRTANFGIGQTAP
jgi:hypothetical protein